MQASNGNFNPALMQIMARYDSQDTENQQIFENVDLSWHLQIVVKPVPP